MKTTMYKNHSSLSSHINQIRHRDSATDHLVEMIVDSEIEPLAMLTISPYKKLDQVDCEHLAGGIRDSIIQRLDPERRIPIFTPLLTIFESNDWDEGYHIHTLIPYLPLDIWSSRTIVKKQVKDAFDAVSKKSGIDWRCGGDMTQEFQIEFYKYCISYPYKTNKWNSNYEHGRLSNYPNGRGSVDYLLADIDFDYQRYAGWMGLVEYMCKNLLSCTDVRANLCGETYMKLHNYNVKKEINNNATSTLEEFFND